MSFQIAVLILQTKSSFAILTWCWNVPKILVRKILTFRPNLFILRPCYSFEENIWCLCLKIDISHQNNHNASWSLVVCNLPLQEFKKYLFTVVTSKAVKKHCVWQEYTRVSFTHHAEFIQWIQRTSSRSQAVGLNLKKLLNSLKWLPSDLVDLIIIEM